jgi:hypothetical protein
MPSKLRVSLYGLGHVPAFKNRKWAAIKPDGSARVVKDLKVQKRMEAIIRDLLSLFISASQTNERGTSMACSRQSLIASYLPGDDSRHWIPRILVECTDVTPGYEGVDITIERL